MGNAPRASLIWALWLLALEPCLLHAELRISPAAVLLQSPEDSQQILVTSTGTDGRPMDVTRSVAYEADRPGIAHIDARGLVVPAGDGHTEIVVRFKDEVTRVPVEVRGLAHPPPISFEQGIVPILTKARCNSGGCHGKAEGQNGFKLTVFGFDPAADHDAISKEGRGRRVVSSAPDQSLFLLKASAELPHGGGLRIEKGSLSYRRLWRWIAEGARLDGDAAPITAIEVEPAARVLFAGESQQLRVTAIDAAGGRRCVTCEAEYESGATLISSADGRGLIEAGRVPGETGILVRYRDQVAVCRVTVPRPGAAFTRPPEWSFIDRLVFDKLERLGIAPSDLADDATFLRRVYLDAIGTLPTADEVRRFLASGEPDKRQKVIDELLDRDEYADYWAMRWSDILRVDRDKLTAEGAVAVTRWLRRQFRENRPYDEIARDIITAQGDMLAEGPASLYRVFDTPEIASRSLSQLFLGVRIECAQCHHHPFEKWSQDDYYALAGFFTGVTRKGLPSGGEALVPAGGSELKHPRTGQFISVRPLGERAPDLSLVRDRRRVLADWMTSPENPYFAKAIANRLWAHYMGRGIVEPLDDLRATNPATHEPALAELARHLRDVRYDLKAFTRTLLNSRVYQLGSPANESNASDEQAFSHAAVKPVPAEVLLDQVSQATGVPEKFEGLPLGFRAIQVWDNRLPSYFFRIFGRPVRASVCECERSTEPSISQALHLMNSPEIAARIASPAGRARRLAESALSPREIVDGLYLATLSRFPRPEEKAVFLEEFAHSDRRSAVEDAMWALLSSKEFIYNH